MANGKDKFGETMRLVEKAKEDIYFAERDRQAIEKLRGQLQKVAREGEAPGCPKCKDHLESYTFQGIMLDRCRGCGGVWMDSGELESVVRKISRGPLGAWIDKLTEKV